MDQLPTTAPSLPVPGLAASRGPLDAVIAESPGAFRGVSKLYQERRDVSALREGIDRAERLMAAYASVAAGLQEAVTPATLDDIAKQLPVFVAAWPNASKADLALYGGQLAEDVIERQPCRYALHRALRHLRQTSKFLPSIAEVLTALDEAQSRIRNTAWHIGQIPTEVEKARANLAIAERRAREVVERWTS